MSANRSPISVRKFSCCIAFFLWLVVDCGRRCCHLALSPRQSLKNHSSPPFDLPTARYMGHHCRDGHQTNSRMVCLARNGTESQISLRHRRPSCGAFGSVFFFFVFVLVKRYRTFETKQFHFPSDTQQVSFNYNSDCRAKNKARFLSRCMTTTKTAAAASAIFCCFFFFLFFNALFLFNETSKQATAAPAARCSLVYIDYVPICLLKNSTFASNTAVNVVFVVKLKQTRHNTNGNNNEEKAKIQSQILYNRMSSVV